MLQIICDVPVYCQPLPIYIACMNFNSLYAYNIYLQ